MNSLATLSQERQAKYGQALDFAQQQVRQLITKHPDYFPIYTEQGRWRHGGELWTDWTGGFLAGMLWQFHQLTGQREWLLSAQHYSRLLEHRQHDRNVHDLGFIFLSTYLPWYRLTRDPALQAVLITAGRTLALRYMPRGQYLCSFVGPESIFIDIMMNVPIILYAARQTGDTSLTQIAIDHCLTTLAVLVRPDGSTAHEGVFDTHTGEFLRQTTHQGLRPSSCWARGLAWSLYGFSKVYGLTGQREFLHASQRHADYWLQHLPADRVPYWDFDADLSLPPPWGAQRETSAAAIAASGLLDLASQTAAEDPQRAATYEQSALEMLDALTGPEYLASATPGWEGILRHGVYHTAKNLGVDESVMWGEYFFVEALCKAVRGKVTEWE